MSTEYIAVVFTILFTIATSVLLGRYMFQVFTGQRTLLDPVLVPIERLVLASDRRRSDASNRTGSSIRCRCWSRTSSCGSRRGRS